MGLTEHHHCCVCDKVLPADTRRLGHRYFCAQHRAEALQSLQLSWNRSGILELLSLTLFVAIIFFSFGARALPTSLTWALVMAVVPTLVWMVFVYRLDRVEPEPMATVIGVGLLSALLTYVSSDAAQTVFSISEWQHESFLAEGIATVLVEGTLQQLCAYVAVRYTVFLSDEFDDPADGVVYATAAGLGVATVLNVRFVIQSGTVLPLEGAVALVSTGLVHVAASAVLGYGLGRARFAAWGTHVWAVAFVLLSSVVNGGLKLLATAVSVDGATVAPWFGLAALLLIAGVVLLLVDYLMVRLAIKSLVPVTDDLAEGGAA